MGLNVQHQLAYQYKATTDAILTDFLKIESVIFVRVELRRVRGLDFMQESPQVKFGGRIIPTCKIWKFCRFAACS